MAILTRPYRGPPVLCSAMVEWRTPTLKPKTSLYRVKVWGKPGGPHDFAQFYDIVARSEDEAARQGLACFTKNVEDLHNDSGGAPTVS